MALNANVLLAAVNRVDTAASITVGSYAAAFPPTNLKTANLSRPYRTGFNTPPTTTGRDTIAGRTWLEIDQGAGYVVQMVALLQHTLTNTATYRVRLSTVSDFSTTVYDSGMVDAWPVVDTFGAGEWGVFPWGGQLQVAEVAYYALSSFHVLPTALSARYIRLDLFDGANPAGFLQLGRLFIGPIWQPSINMNLDWSVGWEDPSEVVRSIGGTITVDERPRYRVLSFVLDHLPEAEALVNITDYLDRRKGISGDMVVIPQPLKPDTWAHEALYGRQRRLDALRSPYVDFRRARAFEIEEIR